MADQFLKDQEDDLESGITCPSCRISTASTRHRTICPFCGSFYDPAAEIDFELRRLTTAATPPSTSHFRRDSLSLAPPSYREDPSNYRDRSLDETRDQLRLPRIVRSF